MSSNDLKALTTAAQQLCVFIIAQILADIFFAFFLTPSILGMQAGILTSENRSEDPIIPGVLLVLASKLYALDSILSGFRLYIRSFSTDEKDTDDENEALLPDIEKSVFLNR
ncbi:hypothetical protein P154DRAFT_582492 [Amniculicola lignicola CBS 123094]|uniref:Uncharacterized protein n=1 Tax=Amniculicola lignicola CBS 123094 TaxID=1392246 RepID=A0A6A5VYC0_9PLEO|nr:hypothetical protein P154DRAFT_582492 [Amniculicola lignicola CBS 123094]